MTRSRGFDGWGKHPSPALARSVQEFLRARYRPSHYGRWAHSSAIPDSWSYATATWSAQSRSVFAIDAFTRLGLDPGRFNELVVHLRQAMLPSNLRGHGNIDPKEVLDFTLTHSVSLYMVPRPTIAQTLLRHSGDDPKVRAILGSQRAQISADCRAVIDGCSDPKTQVYRDLAIQALDAFDADYFAPAQAMAANLLDGFRFVLPHHLKDAAHNRGDRIGRTNNYIPESRDAFESRIKHLKSWEVYVAATLWATHLHYDRETTPGSSFTRHATAHAAGRGKQYNRRSAIQALMAVAGVVGYLERALDGEGA